MTVSLTVAKTLNGSAAVDGLTGGSLGYDWGESQTGDSNPPQFAFFVRHDGTTFITSFAINAQPYTGTYGGDYNASADLAKLVAHGDAGYGMQWDFRWDGSPLFGVKTTLATGVGVSFATRITIPTTALSQYNSGSEIAAVAPVAGKLGEASNVALGDRAHMTMRYLTPLGETAIGKRQWDVYYSYNFTS